MQFNSGTGHQVQALGSDAVQGIGVRSVQDGIDPATTSGRLMLNMLATLAEYEREWITE